MESSVPTARQSALAFTEGVRSGWLTSDLIAWVDEHLTKTERLVLRGGSLKTITEHDWGDLPLQGTTMRGTRPARSITSSQVPQLLDASRQNVVQALRLAIDTHELAFVNAALFASRVLRVRGPEGHSRWRVQLMEGTALSDQVLALFAADALEHPATYDSELAICDACGAVTIGLLPSGSRRGCAAHPFGSAESQRARSFTPQGALRGRSPGI